MIDFNKVESAVREAVTHEVMSLSHAEFIALSHASLFELISDSEKETIINARM